MVSNCLKGPVSFIKIFTIYLLFTISEIRIRIATIGSWNTIRIKKKFNHNRHIVHIEKQKKN